jgi:hypothetical protein
MKEGWAEVAATLQSQEPSARLDVQRDGLIVSADFLHELL